MKWDSYFTSHTKIKSMWIKDLNVKGKTIKLSENHKGEYLQNLRIGKDFLNMA